MRHTHQFIIGIAALSIASLLVLGGIELVTAPMPTNSTSKSEQQTSLSRENLTQAREADTLITDDWQELDFAACNVELDIPGHYTTNYTGRSIEFPSRLGWWATANSNGLRSELRVLWLDLYADKSDVGPISTPVGAGWNLPQAGIEIECLPTTATIDHRFQELISTTNLYDIEITNIKLSELNGIPAISYEQVEQTHTSDIYLLIVGSFEYNIEIYNSATQLDVKQALNRILDSITYYDK